jgi:hypothetical protein
MSTIELPFSVIIYSVVGFLTIGGTLVAVYVSLSNTISNHAVRVHELESKVSRIETVLDEHDEKFVQMFSEIKEGIHRLELSIEKLR